MMRNMKPVVWGKHRGKRINFPAAIPSLLPCGVNQDARAHTSLEY